LQYTRKINYFSYIFLLED